ncbi:hypothetical protein [Streptomyces sp. NBC_00358]|uniref:hypothetical protein n=1 Tax=Streptomyces sp. NBC_00358 TaxID=2975725 RepID=UPI002E254953
MAALITAVTGVLTFLVGFIALPAAGVRSPLGAAATVTATTTAAVTATATVTAPAPLSSAGENGGTPSPGSPTDSYAEHWSGRVKFNGWFNLDSVPPSSDGGGDLRMDGITDTGAATFIDFNMVEMPKGETPTPDSCVLLVKTQPDQNIDLPVGRTICFVTDEGRPAMATVVSLDKVDVKATLDVTVWEVPA